MTRINLVDPEVLSTKHLVAEYREITRLPGNLKKSLTRKSRAFDLSEIPEKYVLGAGHVKFFYDKMFFLGKRFESLVAEMRRRGFKVNHHDSSIFADVPNEFFNDYKPTSEAIEINEKRIKERTR